MRITSVTVENWKSFGPAQTVPLGGLTLLIGPNGAGKTSFLTAVEALRAGIATGNLESIRRADARRVDNDRPSRFVVTCRCEETTRSWSLQLPWTLAPSDGVQSKVRRRIAAHSEVAEFSEFCREAAGSGLEERLRSFAVWRPDFSRFGGPHHLEPADCLSPDGSNATSLLDGFDAESDALRRLHADIRRCAPEVSRVVTSLIGQGHKEVVVIERGGNRIPCRLTSDGFKMLLFVLLILHSPRRPRFLAIEEIEHGIHPRRLSDVIDALRQLSRMPEEPQIIITSHSPLVLDMFRDAPEDVVVFERGDDGCTRCSTLVDKMKLVPSGTEGVGLGDLWYSGVLGGVPQP